MSRPRKQTFILQFHPPNMISMIAPILKIKKPRSKDESHQGEAKT